MNDNDQEAAINEIREILSTIPMVEPEEPLGESDSSARLLWWMKAGRRETANRIRSAMRGHGISPEKEIKQ